MRKLVARWNLREPVMALARSGAPILGTCAGMIVVAREIAGGDEPVFPLLDVTVERNAFGRQLDSFETDAADADPGRSTGARDIHQSPHNRARGTRGRGSGQAARPACRGGEAAECHRHLVPPGAGRRNPHPSPHGHDGGRVRRAAARGPPRMGPSRGRSGRPGERPSPPRPADRSRRPRGALPALPAGKRRRALAGLARERSADRRLQPVPVAARRLPAERPALRLRGRAPHLRPASSGARRLARRVDDRRARCHRLGRLRRHAVPPRPAPAARRRQARRHPLPRRLLGRPGQSRALHAGRLRPLRPGAAPLPRHRRSRCRRHGRTSRREPPASGPASRSTRCRWPACTRP